MTKHEFHNTLRLLLNLEGAQLDFLTDVQKDNFYSNPHMFFIRCDDATAEKLWDAMFPKPPEAVGEKRGNVIWPRDWLNRESVDFEYDTGRVYPLTAGKSAEPAGIGGAWTPGYYDRAS